MSAIHFLDLESTTFPLSFFMNQLKSPKNSLNIPIFRVWWETVKRQRDLVHLQAGKKISKRSTSRQIKSVRDTLSAAISGKFHNTNSNICFFSNEEDNIYNNRLSVGTLQGKYLVKTSCFCTFWHGGIRNRAFPGDCTIIQMFITNSKYNKQVFV